ncbi:MAG: hypothetical protein EXR52_00160 [Dehalococcoidia bacterium]|nr:hypothetical protein [Dehalococcoidia bacterium]
MRLRTIVLFALAAAVAMLFVRAGALAAEDAEVEIEGFAFKLANVTIMVGQAVRFTNKDDAPHPATAVGGEFNSGVLTKGQRAVITFTFPATLAYFCEIHPSIRGSVTVVPGAVPTASPSPPTSTPGVTGTPAPASTPTPACHPTRPLGTTASATGG